MSDTDKLVIKIEEGKPVNFPMTYSNFLLLFPDCPVEETPTNGTISPYGYNVFILKQQPKFAAGPYIQNSDGTWSNTWILI